MTLNQAGSLTSHSPLLQGVLLVDKPAGPTSHDIVDAVRRHFRIDKVGHGGTLDPQATGLLILLLGKATRISNMFLGSDKVYEGTFRLGIATDSQDAQGKVISEADCSGVTRADVEKAISTMKGDLMQTPPMVSAIKVNGVPLYKSARKGKVVERAPRLIHVYEFRITAFNPPDVSFFMRCSKGTYVRTLCADAGTALSCGAHLISLRRLQSGDLSITGAKQLAEILSMTPDELARHVIPIHRVLTERRGMQA
jgi:tRNA pseudouridine55 synthase